MKRPAPKPTVPIALLLSAGLVATARAEEAPAAGAGNSNRSLPLAVDWLEPAFELPQELQDALGRDASRQQAIRAIEAQLERERFRHRTELGRLRYQLLELTSELFRDGALRAPLRARLSRKARPVLGSPEAPIAVDLFTDFTCGISQALEPVVLDLVRRSEGKVRLVAHHFPLGPPSSEAFERARAAWCAGLLGKYWEYRALLFSQEARLVDREGQELLLYLAERAGHPRESFQACLESPASRDAMLEEQEEAIQFGVFGTPLAFVDGFLPPPSRSWAEGIKVAVGERLRRLEASARD